MRSENRRAPVKEVKPDVIEEGKVEFPNGSTVEISDDHEGFTGAKSEDLDESFKDELPDPSGPVTVLEHEAFPAQIAGLAILAAKSQLDRFGDENDNEAVRQTDGSVRLSIKVKGGGGHRRLIVRVPETIELIVCEDIE